MRLDSANTERRNNAGDEVEYTFEQLKETYEDLTSSVTCDCVVATELVGGVPADEKGIRAFAEHHLGLTDEAQREEAVRRILKEEVGERDVTPELGEVKEKQVYGVNVVRRTQFGPYLGDWMLKACIKQAASRVGVFAQIKGTKGNFAEAGKVTAIGASLRDPAHPEHIYLTNSTSETPAHTYFKEFMGRVQSPQGPVSIIHHSECVEPGSHFSFEFRFMTGKVKESDIKDVMAMSMIMGLGSVRSMECGKFRIEKCSINLRKESK